VKFLSAMSPGGTVNTWPTTNALSPVEASIAFALEQLSMVVCAWARWFAEKTRLSRRAAAKKRLDFKSEGIALSSGVNEKLKHFFELDGDGIANASGSVNKKKLCLERLQ
jgi:hypothetical protein